ncbi:MAG: formylglycine-generating enzyme family protein, partial [Gammaproteobacteria bacterium]|nr:formylglycine-generating enzyme family protein [Gammaproteobacteria bacterium]
MAKLEAILEPGTDIVAHEEEILQALGLEPPGDQSSPIALLRSASAPALTAATPIPTPFAGQERYDPVSGIDFVWAPEGCFQMGQSETDKRYILQERGEERYKQYYMNELPQHEVCVDGFWMGKTEVTQAQWTRIMGDNPSRFQSDTNPVEQVSWKDIQKFLQALNKKAGKEMYRLPTEAEWEYAARAGTSTIFYFGDDAGMLSDYAWYRSNSGGTTHPAGQLKPNAWGLYDMHGNVWEWCQDWYDSEYYSKSPKENPQGPSSGKYRVLRGGSWANYPNDCRSATRGR